MYASEEYVDPDVLDLGGIDARLTEVGGPFELLSRPGADVPLRQFRAGPHTLAELFRGLARLGERPFVVADDARISYAGFLDHAQTAAAALHRQGVRPGDRLMLGLPNGLDWLVGFAGAALCGAVVVAPPPDRVDESALAAAGCALQILCVDEWRAWLAEAAGSQIQMASPQPDQEALIVFTSGTSGPPKPVRMDHRGVLSGLRNMMLGNALAAQRRPRQSTLQPVRPAPPCVLVMAPFHHIGGYGQFLLMALLGGRLVAPSNWNPDKALAAIEAEGVRSLQGLLPGMAHDLLDRRPAPGRCASVSNLNFYGAAPSSALVEKLKAIFPQLEMGSGYGLTETNGSVAVASEYDLRFRPGCAGRVTPATEVKIVGPNGLEVTTGAVGEIWLAGPMLARGYGFGQDSPQAGEGGWFCTGDFGALDADRFLYLAERDGATIESGGRRISCLALEQAAQSQPGVRDAAAFGLPDAGLGQRPCVAVVPAKGCDGEDLRRAVARSASISEGSVFVVETIARTASGKVDRRSLVRAMEHAYPAPV